MSFNWYCIAAGAFGLLMGYVFAYASRTTAPNGNEVASLLGTVLGGTATSFLANLHCDQALPIYVIGVAVGYLVYVFLLAQNWTKLQIVPALSTAQRPPLFFWHELRKCPGMPPHAQHLSDQAQSPECGPEVQNSKEP
ncbi:MAG: hypothetical protein ACRD3W_32400 [Terriglobales bacterium]